MTTPATCIWSTSYSTGPACCDDRRLTIYQPMHIHQRLTYVSARRHAIAPRTCVWSTSTDACTEGAPLGFLAGVTTSEVFTCMQAGGRDACAVRAGWRSWWDSTQHAIAWRHVDHGNAATPSAYIPPRLSLCCAPTHLLQLGEEGLQVAGKASGICAAPPAPLQLLHMQDTMLYTYPPITPPPLLRTHLLQLGEEGLQVAGEGLEVDVRVAGADRRQRTRHDLIVPSLWCSSSSDSCRVKG